MVRIIECRDSGVLLVIPEDSHVWRRQEPQAPASASKPRIRRPLADFFRGAFRVKRFA
jgi:hypothetical protein